jgi:hypothetical protein
LARFSRSTLTLLGLALAAACGGVEDAGEEAPEAPAAGAPAPSTAPASTRSVTIASPADGATVAGPSVNVVLEISGMNIVPAADTTPGTGHHHLFLDDDVSPMDQPIPAVPGRIVHLGTGATNYTFENVPAGSHRLIAVVADARHIPLNPPVVDTIRFTVP